MRRPTRSAQGLAALLAAGLLAGAGASSAAPSAGLGAAGSRVRLQVDASDDALVTWTQGGASESVLVPASGALSHGGALRGPDVSRPATLAGLPATVALRRTPDGLTWALQAIQVGASSPLQLDLSRWRGAPTQLTLSRNGNRLVGSVSFHGAPVSGHSYTLAGLKPRVYVYLDCEGCPGKPGWSEMLGVSPKPDGSFAVALRPAWMGTRYRATVQGQNIGSTLSPDAQVLLVAG